VKVPNGYMYVLSHGILCEKCPVALSVSDQATSNLVRL
jgi:hypothetical protein